jgi:adenine phosphoribosyltransferase
MTAAATVETLTRVIPDFPEAGVQFMDLTPVLADASALAEVSDALVAPFLGEVDVIAGVELIRKAGKLPGERIAESYSLEYGEATLEVHLDQVPAGTRVLLVDDVLATGGTLGAAATLIERAGWHVAGISVVLEIAALDGRAAIAPREVAVVRTV